MATTVDVPAERVADPPRASPSRSLVLAGVAAAIAVLCGLALPLAPVVVSEPTVSWPREPGRPESTVLALTGYRPLALDVRFSCAVARRAGADGLVVATTRPGLGAPGLQVGALGERLQIRFGDRMLLDEPMPGGPVPLPGTRAQRRAAHPPRRSAEPGGAAGRRGAGRPCPAGPGSIRRTGQRRAGDRAGRPAARRGRRAAAAVEFDERYPLAAGEDRDWCARLVGSGRTLAFEPAALVRHHQELTAAGFWRQQVRYGRGAYRFRADHSTLLRLEAPRFYAGLLRRGLAEGPRAGALVGLAQLATALGMGLEAGRTRLHR